MKLLKSFGYAFRGIYTCLCLEQNFRIHITAAVTVLLFARFYGLPLAKYPPILMVIVLVMALEAVNTAMEQAVNLTTPKRCPLARIAKDTAAGAVLLAALGSVAVACVTFTDINGWGRILHRLQSPVFVIGLLLYILLFWGFVFRFPKKLTKIETKEETI